MQSALFFFRPILPRILKFLPSQVWGWCWNWLTLLAPSVLFCLHFHVFSFTKSVSFLLFFLLFLVFCWKYPFFPTIPILSFLHTYINIYALNNPDLLNITNPTCTLDNQSHTHLCNLTALRLGSLVSGILSSKSRSSQMSDSRQTPTSSIQSKSFHRGGNCPVLFPSCHPEITRNHRVSIHVPLMFSSFPWLRWVGVC